MASIEETNINSNFVAELENNSLRKMFKKMHKIKSYRRQLFKSQFKMDGGFYILKLKILKKKKYLFDDSLKSEGFIVDRIQAHNIENFLDFQIAKSYFDFFNNKFKVFEN